jgi:hypothetical protein
MSIEAQQNLILELSNMGEGLPGLDPTPIIKNILDKSEEVKSYILMVEEEVQENIDRGMTKEEAEAEAKRQITEMIDKYKETLKNIVNEQIAIIKSQYKVIKDGLAAIPADVKTAIANILLPPSISAPPSAPNPVYALNLVAETKNALSGLLNVISAALVTLIKAATTIKFEVPGVILSLGQTIKTTDTLLSTIPV